MTFLLNLPILTKTPSPVMGPVHVLSILFLCVRSFLHVVICVLVWHEAISKIGQPCSISHDLLSVGFEI